MPRAEWRVFCSPDGYCVVFLQRDFPDHKRLSPIFKFEREAIRWQEDHCRKFQPDPNVEPDWLCPGR